jgi:hypothetical protein
MLLELGRIGGDKFFAHATVKLCQTEEVVENVMAKTAKETSLP